MAPTCAPARAAFAWERRTGSSTRRGNIDAGAVEGAATLSTGAGNVSLRMMGRGGDVETTSGRGSVDLVLPRDFDATLEVAAAYSPGQPRPRITSDVPLDRRDTRDAAGRPAIRATGHTGRGRQRVVVRTAGGDVRIRRSP